MEGFLFCVLALLAIGQCQAINRLDKCPENGTENSFVPNPSDCTSYYQCVGGIPILEHCPPGLEWSAATNVCDWPENANCKETETKPPTTEGNTGATDAPGPPTTAGPKPDKCPEVDGDDDVLLPNPDDCHSFFKCYKGKPVLIQCPDGQEWANDLARCDWPEIAQCSVSTHNPVAEIAVSTAEKCPEHEVEGEDVLLPNPDDCTTFFKCSHGNPVLIACPPGLAWNDNSKECDWIQNTDCKVH